MGNVHNLWTMCCGRNYAWMCHAWCSKCNQRGKRNTVKFVSAGCTFGVGHYRLWLYEGENIEIICVQLLRSNTASTDFCEMINNRKNIMVNYLWNIYLLSIYVKDHSWGISFWPKFRRNLAFWVDELEEVLVVPWWLYFEWMNWKMWMWYHDCCMQEMQHTLICAPWMCNAPWTH